MDLFGRRLASPLGPAAGPHTQLAQNILSAFLAGSRFMELKTVQIMDGEELRKAVPRPCINAADEGYNVEWSTELTAEGAFDEYIKAWFLCHVFAREFGLSGFRESGLSEGPALMFNMSVGYNLEGIGSKKIDNFIEGMKDASGTAIWQSCRRWLLDNISSFSFFSLRDLEEIGSAVSPGITLSTLHGCPAEEIEKIAAYLLEKGLHTFVKCNPTLLGYDTVRRILDDMGYGYVSFDDHHFKNDLQFDDAAAMLGRLLKSAAEKNLSFGVKLTNTFPAEIRRGELPGSEMYMSGRSLFPLSINAAAKLSEAFYGTLPISYSGGADIFNLKEILETGIRPVTAATTLLKPGGYERLRQLAGLAEEVLAGLPAPDTAGGGLIDVKALRALADRSVSMERYRKNYRHTGLRKTGSPLPLLDCAKAPCMDGGCPIHQRIPRYLEEAASGNYAGAFRTIAVDNTAPSITGTICDHQCRDKCTRVDYEDPLEIRRVKLLAADHAQDAYIAGLGLPPLRTDESAAVIGAGPAGMAAAVFLRRNGVAVTVHEKREKPYGIVQYVIPAFRISDEAIYRDFRIAQKLGVNFEFGAAENYSLEELRQKNRFVVIATGAWKEGASPVTEGGENILDALKFLEDSRRSGLDLDLGKNVAVIGGGDVAMDCARAAKRNRGVERVHVVYRRTREFMPARYDEIDDALADGVELIELLAPLSYTGGVLVCEVMELADYGESGRRNIRATGEKRELRFDTVIGAVGARVETELLVKNGVALNEKGFPLTGPSGECSVPGVYIAGDCRAGAATVVKAIADGKAAAADILAKLDLSADFASPPLSLPGNTGDLEAKKGVLVPLREDNAEGFRCLSCDRLCDICVDVCPNRANVPALLDSPRPSRQILHLDYFCNECGNCGTFCPHAGLPYREKFTVFRLNEDFLNSENPGFLKTGTGAFKVRLEDKTVCDYRTGSSDGGAVLPPGIKALIETAADKYGYLL
jgi:putative selenate reductase